MTRKKDVISLDEVLAIEMRHIHFRKKLLQNLENLTKEEVIKAFEVELIAKNRAYYFILVQGLVEDFGIYCNRKNLTNGTQTPLS